MAVQSVKRDDAVRDVEFAEQSLRGGNLVGFLLDIDVRQDQTGPGVECVQQLGRLAIAEIVEAAPQCLAVERDAASCRIGRIVRQSGGVQAENRILFSSQMVPVY